jgi:phosphoribosylformylglycinamidine synthase
MRAAIITFPGINRETDMARAVRLCGGEALAVWHADAELPARTDLVVLPGGFSYGDYLRCGAIAARAPIMDAVRAHAARGGLVLAVCNGFQIACEAGLLPGVLMRNAGMKFVCRLQHLRVERNDTVFTRRYAKGQVIEVAIAHGEGNYVTDAETLARLEGEGRVAFRYCDSAGDVTKRNPNGSANAIAGVYSENFRTLGMMPHPENLVEALVGGTDGRPLFESLAA